MNNTISDPYLNTVHRNLKDKHYKNLREKYRDKEIQKETSKSFFNQEIHLSSYINLSESSINTIAFSSFLFIPYLIGIVFIFLVIAKASIETFQEIDIDDYFVYWSIGYELLAFISILIIIKSAINFKKS